MDAAFQRKVNKYQRLAPGLDWKGIRAQMDAADAAVTGELESKDRLANLSAEVTHRMEGKRKTTGQRLSFIQEFLTKPCPVVPRRLKMYAVVEGDTSNGVRMDEQKQAIFKYLAEQACLAKDVIPLMQLALDLAPGIPVPHEFIPNAINCLKEQPAEAIDFIKRQAVVQNDPKQLLEQFNGSTECVTPRLLHEVIDLLPKTVGTCNLIFTRGGKVKVNLIKALNLDDEELALAYVSAEFEEYQSKESPELKEYFLARIAQIPDGTSKIVAHWLDPFNKEESTLIPNIDEQLWAHMLRLGYPEETTKLLNCTLYAPASCDFRSLMAKGWEPEQKVIDEFAYDRKLCWEVAPQFAVRLLEAGLEIPPAVLSKVVLGYPDDEKILDNEVPGGSTAHINSLVRLVQLGASLEQPVQVEGRPVLPMILLLPEYAALPALMALGKRKSLEPPVKPQVMETGLDLV